MSNNHAMIASRLTGLTNSINKSNELKEFNLQAKTREVFALEKNNELHQKYSEETIAISKRANQLKEFELETWTREIKAIEKANILKERELEIKEREMRMDR